VLSSDDEPDEPSTHADGEEEEKKDTRDQELLLDVPVPMDLGDDDIPLPSDAQQHQLSSAPAAAAAAPCVDDAGVSSDSSDSESDLDDGHDCEAYSEQAEIELENEVYASSSDEDSQLQQQHPLSLTSDGEGAAASGAVSSSSASAASSSSGRRGQKANASQKWRRPKFRDDEKWYNDLSAEQRQCVLSRRVLLVAEPQCGKTGCYLWLTKLWGEWQPARDTPLPTVDCWFSMCGIALDSEQGRRIQQQLQPATTSVHLLAQFDDEMMTECQLNGIQKKQWARLASMCNAHGAHSHMK